MAGNKAKKSNGRHLIRILSFIRPYWLQAVAAILLVVVSVIAELIQPRLIQSVIDEGITQGNLGVITFTVGLMLNDSSIRRIHHNSKYLHVGEGCTERSTRHAIICFSSNSKVQLWQPGQIFHGRIGGSAFKRRQHSADNGHDAPAHVRQGSHPNRRKHPDDAINQRATGKPDAASTPVNTSSRDHFCAKRSTTFPGRPTTPGQGKHGSPREPRQAYASSRAS